MNYIEKEILNLFRKHYKSEYVGGLTVKKIGPGDTGYKLSLYFGNRDTGPLSISADLNAEDFIKYIEQEIKSRQLIKVQWFKGIKIEPEYDIG